MLGEGASSRVLFEPAFRHHHREAFAEGVAKALLRVEFGGEQQFGGAVAAEFVEQRALAVQKGAAELARAHVEERQAVPLGLRDGGEIICVGAQEFLVGDGAGRDELRDLALDQPVGDRRGLGLVGDGDAKVLLEEFLQVGVGAPHRNPGHRRREVFARLVRQGDVDGPGEALGVLAEGLVKVADLKEQEIVGVAFAHLGVLRQKRRQRPFALPLEHHGDSLPPRAGAVIDDGNRNLVD